MRAAAAGLRVRSDSIAAARVALDDRSVEVLRLLSSGADTQQIAQALSWLLLCADIRLQGHMLLSPR